MFRSLAGPNGRTEDGFALVLVSLMAMAFVLLAALVVDVGAWYLRTSRLQRAADAAALAGATSLPDTDAAKNAATFALKENGLEDGVDGITVSFQTTGDRLGVKVTDNEVHAIFAASLVQNISISRTSTAARPSASPSLGSPFNVLGTGDLDVAGIPKQNFWLAVNGFCSPKEDGDYFSAMWDGNKGPFTAAVDADNNYVPASNAVHACPHTEVNPTYDERGYSYFVDVPPPSVSGGTVTLRVYDAAYNYVYASPDKKLAFAQDNWPLLETQYVVWNTNGTQDDPNDDTRLVSYNLTTDLSIDMAKTWIDLYEIPSSMITGGAQFRIQVRSFKRSDLDVSLWASYGTNAFGLGAFRSWGTAGCDSREVADCPRVYGRGAISVYNNLEGGVGDTASFYFAEIDPEYIGQPFTVYLWDPGEGVEKIELLGPDDTPLRFDWQTTPSEIGYSGTNANSINTQGNGPQPGPNRSNPYKFNDRLVTLTVVLPPEYKDMVDNAGGDTWLRLRYTLDEAPGDRTTLGVSFGGDSGGPPHLVRSP